MPAAEDAHVVVQRRVDGLEGIAVAGVVARIRRRRSRPGCVVHPVQRRPQHAAAYEGDERDQAGPAAEDGMRRHAEKRRSVR